MKTRSIILIAFIASILGGSMTLAGYKMLFQEANYPSSQQSQYAKLTSLLADTSIKVPEGLNFVLAAQMVNPAVVHIKNYGQTASAESQEEQMFREFFGGPHGGMGGPSLSAGSGVLFSEDGYIVTNNHVVDQAAKIEVTLNDKRSYTATLIGVDPTTDLAVIKIDEKNLPFVTFGNSDKVKIGEWVLAVGNPFNLTSTVTAGIVSAKARNINILRDRDNMAIESFIQTDAAVNPGNSGGALVNLRGELIGINTAIATPTGTYAGYSFAVPSLLVKKVTDDIIKYGQVQRGLLGVSIRDMNAELAKEKGLAEIKGVYVAGVNSGSAADKVGMKEGDVILKIDETDVNSASELQEIVGRYRPGDKVKVMFKRGDEIQTVEPVLKSKVGEVTLENRDAASVKSLLGADLQTVSSSEKTKLKISGGAKVVKLYSGKLRENGVREGFIITTIDKQPVSNADEVVSKLEKQKNAGGILIGGVYPDGTKAYYGFEW